MNQIERVWEFHCYRVPCREPNLVRHMFCPGEEGKGLTKPVADPRTRESPPARPRVGPRTCGPRHAVRQPPADPFLLFYPRPRGPRTPAHTPHTLAAAANALAVASRSSSARPTRAERARGRDGRRRGGRRRWDGRRPEAPDVRGRVSALSSPPLSFLPLLLAPLPLLPACLCVRVRVSAICLSPRLFRDAHRYLLDFSGPWDGFLVRGCAAAACSAGSRGDRNAGTVWLTEAAQYD